MSIEIIKNVPPPIGGAGRPYKYPFSEMAVGDSFVADASYQSVHKCAARYVAQHAPNHKFQCKKLENNQVQVWRIK